MRSVDINTMKSTGSQTNIGRFLFRKGLEMDGFPKKINSFFRHVIGSLCLVLCLNATVVQGQTVVNVRNNDGEVVFQLEFYNPADGTYYGPAYNNTSSFIFSQAQINAVVESAQYWVDVVKPTGEMPYALDENGERYQVQITDDNGMPVYDDYGQPAMEWARQPVVVRVANSAAEAGNAFAMSFGVVTNSHDKYLVGRPQGVIGDGDYVSTAHYEYVDGEGVQIVESEDGAHALIVIGTGWIANPGNQHPSGTTSFDLSPVIVHELGHALGIMDNVEVDTIVYNDNPYIYTYVNPRFSDTLTRWESRLRDNNGNTPLAGKAIGDDVDGMGVIFDIGDVYGDTQPSQVTFVGKHTLDVLYDGNAELIAENINKGVPLQGFTITNAYPTYTLQKWHFNPSGTFSHIDTTNSLMSWQPYRNYQGFIEVEMATLQDIGYDIDRRNFFGRSFYVDGDGPEGDVFVCTSNFGKWDPNTQSYSNVEGNQSTYAIGIHLYARNLNIRYTGSVLSEGQAGTGIRIDGGNNKLEIARGSFVSAKGVNSVGLLTAYGTDHHIIHSGTLVGNGVGGDAVRFDFGVPSVKYGSINRGSYGIDYYDAPDGYTEFGLVPEIQGALVNQFDITGEIIGNKTQISSYYMNPWNDIVTVEFKDFIGSAIYIDNTAHVETINIMDGASITGDIMSFFNGNVLTYMDVVQPYSTSGDWLSGTINALGQEVSSLTAQHLGKGTTLTFGYKADAHGEATMAIDPDFNFKFEDNINVAFDESNRIVLATGVIDTKFVGGFTEFVGNYSFFHSAEISAGATFTLTSVMKKFEIDDGEDDDSDNLDADGNPIVDYERYPTLLPGQGNYSPEYFEATPKLYLVDGMTNNGRFSGVGDIYTSVIGNTTANNGNSQNRFENWTYLFSNRFEMTPMTRSFINNGTIAPGNNDGEDVGTINIYGNLEFGKNSVYEVTISRERLQDHYGGSVDENGNYIDERGNVHDKNTGAIIATGVDPIYQEGNDLIVVSGNTKLDGTLRVIIKPDSIFEEDSTTYTIIQSQTVTAGSGFTNYENNVGFLNMTKEQIVAYQGGFAVQFVINRDPDFFKRRAKTPNELAVATAIDNSFFNAADIAFSLGDTRNSNADLRNMYRQMGAAHRANSALINLWSPSELLFNRIGWGNGQMETGDRGKVDWNRIAGRHARMLGQSPYRQRTGSIWGDYFNTNFNADTDGNSAKYNIHRNGFMIGGEWNLTPYSAVGAIFSYADSKLKQSSDTVKSDDYMLGLYFVCAPFNEFEFKGYIGTGFQEYDFDRYVRNANIYTDSATDLQGIYDRYVADTKGNTLNISLELARPLMLHPTFILRPTLGIDSQFMWQDAFKEKNYNAYYNDNAYGSYLYALNYKRMKFNRSLLRAGFSSETTGSRGGIRMRAFYVTRIDGDDCPTSNVRFMAGGDQFAIQGVKMGSNFLSLGVGTNLWLDGEKTCSFFLDYDANIYNSSRKLDVHTFSIGLLQNF